MTAIRTIFLPDWQYTVNCLQNNPCAIVALLQKSAGWRNFPVRSTIVRGGAEPVIGRIGAARCSSRDEASIRVAVLFVPTFFVEVRRFENWLAERKRKAASGQTVPQAGS